MEFRVKVNTKSNSLNYLCSPMRILQSTTIFLFTLASVFYSQEALAKKAKWHFNIKGQVVEYSVSKYKNVALDSCTISLYKDSVLVTQIFNPDSARFAFSLDPDAEYVLACGKTGYITNRIAISTKDVPDGKTTNSFNDMSFQIILYKTYPDYDYSFLQKPLVRICFNYAVDDFDYDETYELSMAANYRKMEGLSAIAMKHELYADEIKRGDEFFAKGMWDDARSAYLGASANLPMETYPLERVKVCDANLAVIKAAAEAKDKQYSDLLAAADAKFEKKDFMGAKVLYEQASSVHPELLYPRARIMECDKSVGDTANDPNATDKNYQTFIANGDAQFKAKNYLEAKNNYRQATTLKPNEQYPKDQINKCDEALNNAENAKKYVDLISIADNLFSAKDWQEAKSYYAQASTIKPAEQYPKDRIQACDRAIADQAKNAANPK